MSSPSSSRTSGRSRRPGGGDRSRFRDEVRVEDPPHARGSRPFRSCSTDLDTLMEERPVEHEGLEFPALAARMHAAGSLQAEEVLDGRCIPTARSAVMCKFGTWKSIDSRSAGRIERRCVSSHPRWTAAYAAYVESLPPEKSAATRTVDAKAILAKRIRSGQVNLIQG